MRKTLGKPIRRKGKPRFPKGVDRAYRAWIRGAGCRLRLWGECGGEVEAAHVKSRGAGGGDRANLVPLCHAHHAEQHRTGIKSFAKRYRINLAEEAAWYATQYAKSGREGPQDAPNPPSR